MKELEAWVSKNVALDLRESFLKRFYEVLANDAVANSFEARIILEYYPNAKIRVKKSILFTLDSERFPNAKIV